MTPEPPPPGSALRWCTNGDVVSYDMPPTGYRKGHGVLIGLAVMLGTMCGPGGYVGAYLGWTAQDWEMPIRLGAGIGGALVVLFAVLGLYYALGHPFLWRERVQVGPGGFVVRRGLPGLRRRDLLPARSIDEIEIDNRGVRWDWAQHTVLPGPRVAIRTGKRKIFVGTGLSSSDVQWLLGMLKRAWTVARDAEPRPVVEWKHRVPDAAGAPSPPWTSSLLAELRRPSPFLVFDVLVLLGAATLMTGLRADSPELLFAKPAVYLLFCFGLALLLGDERYLRQLAGRQAGYHAFWLFYFLGGAMVGFQGSMSLMGSTPELEETLGVDRDVFGWAGLALGLLAPALHVLLLRRARRLPGSDGSLPPRRIVRELLVGLCLLGMALMAELHLYAFFTHGQGGRLGVLILPIVLMTIVLGYLPIRMHYFIGAPRNRRSWISFGFTCLAMTIYAVGHG
jgi:hypothetical protein